MNTHTVAITALALVILSGSAWAEDKERLLPSEEAAKISMTWHQDGRAQLVTVKNNSLLVLTSADLFCTLYDSKKPLLNIAPTGLKWCTSDLSNGQYYRLQDEGFHIGSRTMVGGICQPPTLIWNLTESVLPVLPGKSKEFYFEREAGRLLPVGCSLQNPRGRAKKFLDF